MTVTLVTAAVAAVSAFGVRLLKDLAEEEALARVELAVTAARETQRQSLDDLETATQVLSERPTLHRLLVDGQRATLEPYLARYCEGARLDACAALRGNAMLAASGSPVDWVRVLAGAEEQGDQFMVTGAMPGTAVAGARAEVAGTTGGRVLGIRLLDRGFAMRLSERAGLDIRVVDYASYNPARAGRFAALNADALSGSGPTAGRLRQDGDFAASLPLAASTGEVVALLQATLPEDEAMEPVAQLTRQMVLVALLVVAAATMAGIYLGRRWIRRIGGLTSAARQIGSGDLAAAIPAAGRDEIGLLADTMEEMRRNLIELTSRLRRSEAEARAVLGGIVEGVYAVDMQRRVTFMNPQAERLLGVTGEEAIGRFCGDVLNPRPDDKGRPPCVTACPILEARREGAAQAAERIQPTSQGLRHAVISSAAPADGIQVQVLRDETELEAVRRTRDTVLANISHEFRTPLAAQLASIELLREGLGSMQPEAQRELVLSLERGTQRLTRLIDNLLESVRIESGQLTIRRQEVQLHEVMQAARELIAPLLEQRGQALDLALPDELPSVRGDRQRLIQVMVNLLANASKFGPPDSTVRVGARSLTAGGLSFWVEDEGPGPAAGDGNVLFEQFRRSAGDDPEESGLGLGLYIVRSIVERHGGRVGLTRVDDRRTRVEVWLP